MAARGQNSGACSRPSDRNYGAVCRCPGATSSGYTFCSTPDFETVGHINWSNILASFASLSAKNPNRSPSWADALLQPSQSEPGIKHIRCRRSFCRGDVLGFLLGIMQTSTQAGAALSACSTPQDALGLASRMHTFRTPPVPGSTGQENVLRGNEQLPRILTLISSSGPGNPFAQMLETTEAPNAAVVMITNFPSGVIYFPVIALRNIAAGEIIRYKKAESSNTVAIRAFMQAARSGQAASTAAPADSPALCRPPPLQAAPAGTCAKVLGEVAFTAHNTIQEVRYMLQAAVAACDIQPAQQQLEQQEAGGVQLLGRQLLKVNQQLQQAESLLAATRQQPAAAVADGIAAAAPSGTSDPVSAAAVEHPETPDADVAMQHAANQQPTAAATAAAVADPEYSVQNRPAARPSVGARASISAGGVPWGPAVAAAISAADLCPSVQAANDPSLAAALPGAAGTLEPTAAAASEPRRLPSPKALGLPVVPPQEPWMIYKQEPCTGDMIPAAAAAAVSAAAASRKRPIENTVAASGDDSSAAGAAADAITSQPAQKRARKPSTKQQEQQAFEEEERKANLRQQRRQARQQSAESESPAAAGSGGSGGSAGGGGSCSIRGSVALAGKAAAGVAQFTVPRAVAVGPGAGDLQEQLQLLKAYATSSSKHSAQQGPKASVASVADGDASAAAAAAVAAAAAAKRLRVLAEEGKQQKGFSQAIPVLIKLLGSTAAVLHVEAAAALEVLSLEEKHAPSISRGIPRFVELLTAYTPILLGRDRGGDSSESASAAAPAAEAQRDVAIDTAQQVVQHVSALLYNLLEAVTVAKVISSSGGDKALLQLLDQVLSELESSSSGSIEGRVSRSSNAWDLSSSSSAGSSKLGMLDPVLGSLRHMAYPSLDDDDVPRAISKAGGVALFVRAVIGSTATIKHLIDQQLAAQQKLLWRSSSTSPGAKGSPAAAAAAAGSAVLCKETIQNLQLLQEHAVGALWNIARVTALQPKIHSTAAAVGGGMGPCDAVGTKALGYKQIVQCLSSDSPRVQYEACGLLQWLAVGISVSKTAIPEAGGIAPLVGILCSSGDGSGSSSSSSVGGGWTAEQMELKGNAAGALWHLAEGSKNNQIAIAAAGAVPHLVKMLSGCKSISNNSSSSLETMQREAAGALRALASNMPANKDSIAKANGVAKLVALLSSSKNASVLAVAAAALAEVVKGKPAIQKVAIDAGAGPVLKALVANTDRDVSTTASAALGLLA